MSQTLDHRWYSQCPAPSGAGFHIGTDAPFGANEWIASYPLETVLDKVSKAL